MIESLFQNKNKVENAYLIEVLTKCFAGFYNVPNCKISIQEFNGEFAKFNNNPAFYMNSNNTIYFRKDIIEESNTARIIKLTAHEWMHYYVNLVKQGIVKKENIVSNKELLEEAINEPIKNVKRIFGEFIKAYEKLSASEVLADNFAQDILKEYKFYTKDDFIKKEIDKQIENHEIQVENMKKILNKNKELYEIAKKLK